MDLRLECRGLHVRLFFWTLKREGDQTFMNGPRNKKPLMDVFIGEKCTAQGGRLIVEAAKIQGLTKSSFIRFSALQQARRVIRQFKRAEAVEV
jgi:hypothetical protein